MKLIIEKVTYLEFGRGYIYQVLFQITLDDFKGWCNELTIYKR